MIFFYHKWNFHHFPKATQLIDIMRVNATLDQQLNNMDELNLKDLKREKKTETIRTESILRETSNHYIRLIGDADRKARIMIVVNSILLTAGVTIISRVIHHDPLVWISASILICSNLVTLFYTIVSVKPELHSNINAATEDNMLHYKKCMEYNLAEYTSHMLDTMHSNDKKIDAIIKEMYYFGNLLGVKYRLMKIAYRFFFWGILVAVVSYLVILLLTKSSMFNN